MSDCFDPIAFGLAVKKKRESQRQTLRELAAFLGVSPSTVFRVEEGSAPHVEHFFLLSKWLGKPTPKLPTPCRRCNGSGIDDAD